MEENTWVNRVFCKSSEVLAEIPDGSVHTCVTSPPYFSLREYGHPEQIGLEPTLDEYVEKLVAVFREVRRTLRDDGTLWLNIGDSWAANRSYRVAQSLHGDEIGGRYSGSPVRVPKGLKPKDQMLVPHTVAMALRADGWWLRDTIIWHKPNPMPSSVRDRTTPAHEYIFLLTKSARYFYDQHAIREPLAKSSQARLAQDVASQNGSSRANGGKKTNGTMKAVGAKPSRFGGNKGCADNATYSGNPWIPDEAKGANARSVWTIATAKYSGDHYAVMPRELARRCILAGSPAGGLILDPFAGTGTTLEVALGCGRKYVGYELNPEYCEQIRDRLGLFAGGAA